MLPLPKPAVYHASKCVATYGQMPHLTPGQQQPPSSRRRPWAALLAQDFAHRVDLVLPEDAFLQLEEGLSGGGVAPPVHFRVTAALGALLDGAFYLEFVKTGKVAMLSQGIQNIDNIFTIVDGELTMYLDKETYERAGLVGKPDGAKGNRAGKPRWIVRYDLKAPSMLHGKKGFDRLLYACRNVFSAPVTWLYSYTQEPDSDPLKDLDPVKFTARYAPSPTLNVNTPPLSSLTTALTSSRPDFDEAAAELYEWLSLVRLSSPRVEVGDSIDPYLSGYRVPGDAPAPSRLRRVSWRGFISPTWVRDTLARVLVDAPSRSWLSLSATAFGKGPGDTAECTFFRPPDSGGQYLLWEIRRD
ncbi:hypothetical protein VUR80DRAFT_9766 [Thermomyces stellatus]